MIQRSLLSGAVVEADLSMTPPAERLSWLNNMFVRDTVVEGAAKRFGYSADQVELRLYVGKFADKGGSHETRVRQWCAQQHVGAGPIQVVGVDGVVARVRALASSKQYRDNAALVAMKVLEAAGALNLALPDHVGNDDDEPAAE